MLLDYLHAISGLDYNHGTSHGIGSFLSLHESLGTGNLVENMILSNEPGYYEPGNRKISVFENRVQYPVILTGYILLKMIRQYCIFLLYLYVNLSELQTVSVSASKVWYS